MARSDAYAPACSIKGAPMAPEKEAFLHEIPNNMGDDDEDSWGDRRFTKPPYFCSVELSKIAALEIHGDFNASLQSEGWVVSLFLPTFLSKVKVKGLVGNKD